MKKDNSGKRCPVCLKILIGLLAVILVLLIAAAVTVNVYLDRIGTKALEQGDTIPPEQQDFETDATEPGATGAQQMNREDVTWADVEQLESGDIINILLIGQDARPGETRARSDSMILVSINKSNNTIHLTSFMRDLYVQIPGYASNRINAAYRFGGTELLNETIKTNFGITIDGNVEVNFDQFETIIDILGGVDVELDSEEAWYLNDRMELGPVEEGTNHLNGEQALGFARMRYITGSDFARTQRQREVITAVAASFKTAGVSKVLEILDEVLPYVSTDLSKSEIVSYLASAALIYTGGGDLISGRVPMDDGYYDAEIDGMQVLVPYLDRCQEYLKDSIYTDAP